jgi:6-pyruvoyl-tetrahydropterin synthase
MNKKNNTKKKTTKLTENNCDIIADALEEYVKRKKYSGIFSKEEVEETFWRVQDIWKSLESK